MRAAFAAACLVLSGGAEAAPKVITLPPDGVVVARPVWFTPGRAGAARDAAPLPDRPTPRPGGPRIIRVPETDPGGSGERG